MYIVFEKKPNNNEIKQISIPFETEQEAIEFIDVMKIGKDVFR